MLKQLVCKAKDKNKIKSYEQKVILLNLSLYLIWENPFGLYGLASIAN